MSFSRHEYKPLFKSIFAYLLFAAMSANGLLVEVLDNGLQIIVKENHIAPVASVRIYVKTGSIYEQEYLGSGISHYFEHLINGGTTTTRSEKEIRQHIDNLGGVNNAYTTKDHTCYFITTSSEKTEDAVRLMADWMINSAFPQTEVDRERGVVLEELRKGKEEPYRILNELLYETMFTNHPVRYPTIGYEPIIQSVTREDLIKYYKRMYVPNNMVVVAVGSFNQVEVQESIRDAFSDFQRRPIPAISIPKEPKQLGKRTRTIKKTGLGEAYLNIAFHTVTIDDSDMYPLDVLSYILSHGRSSRLVKHLREEKRLVSSIYTYSYTPNYDAGMFVVSAVCDDGNIEPVTAAVLEELKRIQNNSVGKSELEKAIKQKIAEDILGVQTAVDEASELGINMITTGNPEFNSLYLNGIRNVGIEDIRRVAQKYFQKTNATTVVLRPETLSSAVDTSAARHHSEPIEFTELNNGIRLLVKRNPNIPLVNLQILFLGGVLYEPQDQAGICGITAEMLTRGNTTMSRDEIASVFDGIGGKFSSSSGNNTFGLTAEVLKDDFDTALAIVAESIQSPTFPAGELETVNRNTLSAISRRRDRWDSEITHLFRQAYFKHHPYQHDHLGAKESVEALSTASIKRFYDEFVVPERCIVTVFGDIDPERARIAVTKAFKNFTKDAVPLPSVAPIKRPAEDRVIVEKVEKDLSAVYVGYPGIRITNSVDRFPLIILDTIISGFSYPGGWLYENLRGGDRDYVYTVHAFNFMGVDPGYFAVMAASSPAKMDKVVEIILKDIDRIRSETVTDAELEKAKTICITAEKLSRQTNADMALMAAVNELYGLGYDFSDQFAEKINAVTADDVLRVAQKYFTNYVMVRTEPDRRHSDLPSQ